jgi:hypothetical protein
MHSYGKIIFQLFEICIIICQMIMDGIFRHAKNTIPSEPLTYLNQKTQEKWYYRLSTLRDITDIFLGHSDTEFTSTVFPHEIVSLSEYRRSLSK